MIREWFWPVAPKKKPAGAIILPDDPPLPSQSADRDRGLHEILPKRSFATLGVITIAFTAILLVRALYVAMQVVVTALRRAL